MEPLWLKNLRDAEAELQTLQTASANRDRAIALTHLQTALLWLCKPRTPSEWKPDIMPPLPDDPNWMVKLQGDAPADAPFYTTESVPVFSKESVPVFSKEDVNAAIQASPTQVNVDEPAT